MGATTASPRARGRAGTQGGRAGPPGRGEGTEAAIPRGPRGRNPAEEREPGTADCAAECDLGERPAPVRAHRPGCRDPTAERRPTEPRATGYPGQGAVVGPVRATPT